LQNIRRMPYTIEHINGLRMQGKDNMMDIQKIITEAVKALSENEELLKAFDKNPAKTIEKIIGFDLPDDKVNAIVVGIKAKLGLDDVMDVAGKLLGMFGKK